MRKKTDFGTGNGLRQKAINLFYLIFLVLVFSFIPTDFVDSTHHANTSLDLISNDLQIAGDLNTQLLLRLIEEEGGDPLVVKQRIREVNSLCESTTSFIDQVKIELISKDQVNEYGFFENGRQEYASKEVMIDGKRAETLFNKLQALQTTLSDYLSPTNAEKLRKIFDLQEYVINSDGNYVDATSFYFKHTPLNITVLNLSHFKSRVERAKLFTQQQLAVEAISYVSGDLSLDWDEWIDQDITSNSTPSLSTPVIDNELVAIDGPQNATVSLGQSLTYKIRFNNDLTPRVIIDVEGPEKSKYTLDQSDHFFFCPRLPGKYTINLIANEQIQSFTADIRPAETVLQSQKLPALYIGLLNKVELNLPPELAYEQIEVVCNNGKVSTSNNEVLVSVSKKGIATLKVYANLDYGRILVAEQPYKVRDINAPTAILSGRKSGQGISVAQAMRSKNLSLLIDELLVGEPVEIVSYSFSKIFNDHGKVSAPESNRGAAFNPSIQRSMRQAKAGDLIVFYDIRVKLPDQSTVSIPSLTLKVY